MDLEEFRRERDERLLQVAIEEGYPIPRNLKPGYKPPESPRGGGPIVHHVECIHCHRGFGIDGGHIGEVSICYSCLDR